jgi:signal transduction histidine kinase/CheY-like chemotaxis protein
MTLPIISVPIHYENDTVAARQRARQIARFLGFDVQDQTRISTAVSEIARNAFNYAGGGRVDYLLEGRIAPQLLIVKVTDTGPGIRDLDNILNGQYQSQTGMGLGIVGARRIMDRFEITSKTGEGTSVLMKKLLPNRARLIRQSDLGRLAGEIAGEKPQNAFQEVQHQNRELLSALEEIRTRQIQLTQLNQELEDTNRGVVALYAELDEKADHLRRADELKSKFLFNMSHEFRSPLNSILALSGLLLDRLDGDLTQDQDQQVHYIKRAAQDLLDMVNDLLDLAKVEAGKVDVKPVEFEVSDLFATLRGMIRPLFINHSVDLVFEEAGHMPRIFSDERKVSQILRNFLSNALKFTEKGEVRVSASLSGEDSVVFSVVDSGIGVALADQNAIFQDFVQVDHPIQKTVKGTGLGLPLSRKLSALLGGSVQVKSQPGVGSTFSLRIPIRFHEASAASEPRSTEFTVDPASIPVLVVDDRPETMMSYRTLLSNSGFQAVSASTIREAEELVERVRPRAVIVDIVMRKGGWEMIARLKENSAIKEIPLLVAGTLEDQSNGVHHGVSAYMLKPFERSVFIEKLHMLTGQPSVARLLLIDDDERARYIFQQQIKDIPLEVTECSTGAEGISQARRDKPDVIFLDLEMPDMNGFEVLDELKSEPTVRNIPVIIVTSRVLTAAERLRLLEKAFAILSKGESGQMENKDCVRRTLKDMGLLRNTL